MATDIQAKYEKARTNAVVSYKFPINRIENIRHKIMMIFYDYSILVEDGTLSTGKMVNKQNLTAAITLPVPIKVAENYNIQYSTINASDLIGKVISAKASGANQYRNNSRGFAGTVQQWGDFAKAGVNTAMAAGGIEFNPYTLLQLKGVNLRRHNFRWKLHPESLSDTYQVENIIKTLRLKMHPELYMGDILLKYPNVLNFKIFGATDPDNIYPTAPCVIESIVVDRTGGDYPAYFSETGLPVVYGLQINLIEILPMYRKNDELNAAGVPFLNDGGVVDSLVKSLVTPSENKSGGQ